MASCSCLFFSFLFLFFFLWYILSKWLDCGLYRISCKIARIFCVCLFVLLLLFLLLLHFLLLLFQITLCDIYLYRSSVHLKIVSRCWGKSIIMWLIRCLYGYDTAYTDFPNVAMEIYLTFELQWSCRPYNRMTLLCNLYTPLDIK